MVTVAIVGAGQIGSRHLQALAASSALAGDGARLVLVDPSEESLRRAAARYAEVGGRLSLDLSTSLDALAGVVDVAVVATGADVRRRVTEQLLARCAVKHVIFEKVLFQAPADYPAVAEALARAGTTAWVNCPRRQWPTYRELRAELPPLRRVGFHVSGAGWGLACNAVHFLDLFAFLTGEDGLTISAASLHPGTVPSKRPGFVEVNGTLTGTAADGSHLSLTHHAAGSAPLVIAIDAEDLRLVVREGDGVVLTARASDGWRWHEAPFVVRYQSQLTQLVVDDLVTRGTCDLTPFAVSSRLHLALLDALVAHLSPPGADPVASCPIT